MSVTGTVEKIDEGGRVSVSGNLDLDFFERNEIQTNYIVTVDRDKTKK